MKKLIRDNISKVEHYEPGMSIEILRSEFLFEGEISKLASNENPLGPSPHAVCAIKEALENGNLYPDDSCFLLRKKIAGHLGISTKNLCIGNGSTELIYLLGIVFLNPEESLVMSQCSFIMGKMAAQIVGCKLIEVPLKDYRHDLDEILRIISDKTKIVYLDNPMNPIGTILTKQEISGFMDRVPDDVIVVFDEAYYDYVSREDYPNTLKYIEEGKNVITLRTFSKLYGLAGFRVGYCAAKEEFIQAIHKVRPPFSVNRLAQVGAAAAIEDKEFIKKTRDINESGKKFLYESFERLSVFYIPSETNFVTIDVKRDAERVSKKLQGKGVIVRPLTMYGKPTFLRVTIGTPEQNKRFVGAFEQIYTQ